MSRRMPSFAAALYAELKRWPWRASSLAFHGVLALVVFQIGVISFEVETAAVLEVQSASSSPVRLQEELKPEIIEGPPVEIGEGETLVIDRRETDADLFYEETAVGLGGFDDSPFVGPSTNAAVGIGGGAGGAFRGRGGHPNLRAGGGARFGGREEVLVIVREGQEEPPVWRGLPITEGILFSVGPDETLSRFPLAHTDVKAHLSSFLARVDVTQQFRNHRDEKVEAIYVFPLPRNAAVCDFELVVGDRRIHGMIREREEAIKAYEEAKRRGQVASLMTQERPNIFVQKVANLEPERKVDVSIRYFHPLRAIDGGFEFVFPMVVGPRYTPLSQSRSRPPASPVASRPGHDLSLSVSIDAGVSIEKIASPTHRIAATRPSPSTAEVVLTTGSTIPNKDFVLRYRVVGEAPKYALLTHRGDRGGFFAFVATPKAEIDIADQSPRELVFVLDCSGSMSGAPIRKSKAVVRRFLEGMSPRDTFRIVRFAANAKRLSDDALPATPENRQAGLEFVEGLSARGGTEMLSGIRAALAPPSEPGRVRYVCFLTDGFIGNENQVLAVVRKTIGDARIFSFGVGSSPNRYLLDLLAVEGHGAVQYVLTETTAEDAAEEFFHRLDAPCLTDLELDFGGIPVRDVEPARLPDVYRGRPVTVVGRYEGGGPTTITIRGRSGGYPFVTRVPVNFPEWNESNEVLGRVWARGRIEALMSEMIPGVTAEGKSAVTRLALDYGLLSAFTAFLAVDEGTTTIDGDCVTINVPVYLPEGVRYEGVFGDGGDLFELSPLGIRMAAEQYGLRVTNIRLGSPGDLAGLEPGDLVTAVNGESVRTGLSAAATARQSETDPIRLDVRRPEGKVTVRFTPEDR